MPIKPSAVSRSTLPCPSLVTERNSWRLSISPSGLVRLTRSAHRRYFHGHSTGLRIRAPPASSGCPMETTYDTRLADDRAHGARCCRWPSASQADRVGVHAGQPALSDRVRSRYHRRPDRPGHFDLGRFCGRDQPAGCRSYAADRPQVRRDRLHGAATVAAIALPAFSMARPFGTRSSETRRMTIEVDIDQKPPMATPSNARPTMSNV